MERGESDPRESLTIEAALVDALPPYRRPMLGILPVAVPEGNPVEVAWVWPEGPAAQAGILAGDRVESLQTAGGEPRPIQSGEQLAALLASLAVGEDLRLQVRRGDAALDVGVQTAAAACLIPPPDVAAAATPAPVTVEPLTAPEVANPPLAVIPELEDGVPMGVLIHFGPPRGGVNEADAEPWRLAAGRYGIAVCCLAQVSLIAGAGTICRASPGRWRPSAVVGQSTRPEWPAVVRRRGQHSPGWRPRRLPDAFVGWP